MSGALFWVKSHRETRLGIACPAVLFCKKNRKMKAHKLLAISILWMMSAASGLGQNLQGLAEVQSKFIDITGLFGVAEPALMTQFSLKKRGFGLELQHSFSLEHFGQTIQTVLVPSHTFPLGASKKWWLKTKVDVAHIQSSGGAFVRPGALVIYKPNGNHTFTYGNWLFFDNRSRSENVQKREGLTWYFSYTHKSERPKWAFSQECRTLFVDVKDVLKVGGVFQNVKFTHRQTQLFVGATGVYTYYHSKTGDQFFWNLFFGKNF